MTIKVVFVDQSGQCGGAELMLVDLLRQLRGRLAVKVVLFADGPFTELLRRERFAVSVLPLKFRTTKNASKLSRLLDLPLLFLLTLMLASRARRCDLIYANTPKAMVVGALAARLSGKRLLFHLHDILDVTHFSPANVRLLVNLANAQASAVVANSMSTGRSFVAAGGRASLVTQIYNGFDTSAQPRLGRAEARMELGWSFEQPVAVIVGRIAEWKGQHVLLEALRLAKHWQACIVGDALFNEGDSDYKQRLHTMARDPVLAGRVMFTGFVDNPSIYYAAADAVVHCSTAPEPFGRVIVEGLLARRPVIATNHGGAIEILRDGVTGWLVSPGNPIRLAGVLKWIADHPDSAALVASAGREDAQKRFGLNRIANQVFEVIKNATRANRRLTNVGG
jgi:glycosyltransferase involved in cell wall biosynthesis